MILKDKEEMSRTAKRWTIAVRPYCSARQGPLRVR